MVPQVFTAVVPVPKAELVPANVSGPVVPVSAVATTIFADSPCPLVVLLPKVTATA
jgi:hypothetical protein